MRWDRNALLRLQRLCDTFTSSAFNSKALGCQLTKLLPPPSSSLPPPHLSFPRFSAFVQWGGGWSWVVRVLQVRMLFFKSMWWGVCTVICLFVFNSHWASFGFTYWVMRLFMSMTFYCKVLLHCMQCGWY